ncbi:MAG TPA: PadR family transcriptional regulator [Telluria sp.]|jgi:DNA-binding PadR family transcriptional regulator|nr:PadR family transcriptional regulator [Telluria sp.]
MFRFMHHHRFQMHSHGHHHHGGGRERGPKMFDAGAMRYVVLHLLAEKPRHGYELIKEIEQLAGGGYTPSPGAIYPLLAMLLDLGHIDSSADGNKKLHTITPEGQAFLDDNRQLVDAVLARLHHPVEGGRGGLRSAMHALKEVVIQQARSAPGDDGRMAQIIAILQRAMHDIGQLDKDAAR